MSIPPIESSKILEIYLPEQMGDEELEKIVREMVDDIAYERRDGRNILTMSYYVAQ